MPSPTPPAIPAGRIAASVQPVIPIAPGVDLRPWSVADAPAVIAAYADPDIRHWHARAVDSEAEARALIERWRSGWAAESGAAWAVVREDIVVGRIALRSIDTEQGRAECAYWVRPEARGGGLAGRALSALATWAFDVAGFHRLFLVHSTANDASCRVAVKAVRARGCRAELHAACRRLARHACPLADNRCGPASRLINLKPSTMDGLDRRVRRVADSHPCGA